MRRVFDIFRELEKTHGIQFNYAVEEVEDTSLSFPELPTSLEETLSLISKRTGLQFKKLNDRIVIVTATATPTLCGYVKDSISTAPLEGVQLFYGDTVTVSNAQGYFSFPLGNSEQLLSTSLVGYTSQSFRPQTAYDGGCIDVFLLEKKIELSPVSLTTYLIKGIDKAKNGSLLFDFEKFTLLPGLIEPDVLQTAQALPGIQSVDETVSNINIRGGSNDQNLLLWDDIKMYQSGHFFGLISAFNPQITQRVTLTKNGTHSSYTDGVSGTIVMETDKEINDTTKGNIGLNLVSADGFIDLHLSDKSSLQMATRHSLSDVLNTPTYDTYFNRISQNTELARNDSEIVNSDQSFNFYDASLRWLYNVSPKDKIRLNFILIGNDLSFDENRTGEDNIGSRRSSLKQNSIAAGLLYRRIWSTKTTTRFHMYETDYTLRAINANVLENQRFLQENVVSETSITVAQEVQLNDRWDLDGGYHFVETGIENLDDVDNPIFRRRIAEVLRAHGVFGHLQYRSLSQKTILNTGVRYNYIEKFNRSLIEPRLVLRHKLTSALSLELLGEFKHQNTSQIINFQNDFLGIEKRRWQLANEEEIPIIQSKQFSTGVTYTNKGYLLDLSGYYKKINGITTQSQGFDTKYEFTEAIGSYKVKGLDVLLRKEWLNLTTWLSYGTMNNTYEFASLEDQEFSSNFDITHALKAGVTYSSNRLRLSAGWNWRSGRPFTIPDTNTPVVNNALNFTAANQERLPQFMRLDLSGLYNAVQTDTIRLEVGGSLWNVTNRENIIAQFYRVQNGEEINTFFQKSLGITFNATARLYIF